MSTGAYGTQKVEQWEPCESRGSRTVLRAAEGEAPSAYSPPDQGRTQRAWQNEARLLLAGIRRARLVCFPFFPSRDAQNVQRILGVDHAPGSVIWTDGYADYASYAKKVGIAHALCWSHSRREFVDAQAIEPQGVIEALRRISALYAIEDDIRKLGLTGEAKQLHRLTHSKSHVEAFFAWVDRRLEEHGYAPAHPLPRH